MSLWLIPGETDFQETKAQLCGSDMYDRLGSGQQNYVKRAVTFAECGNTHATNVGDEESITYIHRLPCRYSTSSIQDFAHPFKEGAILIYLITILKGFILCISQCVRR